MKTNQATKAVLDELAKAQATFPPFHSRHEGYAVLLEEVNELWDEIKEKHPSKDQMRKEATQVAAMAMRFLIDNC